MTTTAPPEAQVPIQPTDRAIAWLRGRTFAELGAIEAKEICIACRGLKMRDGKPCEDCEGTGRTIVERCFFPFSLKWRDAKGIVQEDKLLITIPREDDLQRAQDETIRWFAAHYDDPSIKTEEQATARAGALRYAAKERAALLSRILREVAPPHIQAFKLRTLLDRFDPHTLDRSIEEMKYLREVNEITVADLTERQLLEMAREVARVENISPLLGLDGALQGKCVRIWARAFVDSQTHSLSSGSAPGSTQET